MDQRESIDKLRQILRSRKNIVFFGGAGVSTESGIPDFRSAGGLYKEPAEYPPEEILSAGFFKSNPETFYRYYFGHMIYPGAKPNAAHRALAQMEKEGRLSAVITQNIDGLHQRAGSSNVIELHGSVLRNICTGCGQIYSLDDILKTSPAPPRCSSCGGLVKPEVVLYGEALPENAIARAIEAVSSAGALLVGGTSLSVYPAAGLIRYYEGDALIIINRDKTPYDRDARLLLRGNIGEILEAAYLK